MEDQEQDSDFGFGLFADYPEDELHPLQIDVFETEDEEKRKLSPTNIYQPVKEGTQMHRAIRKGDQTLIDKYLAAYQEGFDKIRNYLLDKYQWNGEDRIWLRKYNLIAVGEEQCNACKELEKSSARDGNLEKAVFILLTVPVDGEEVAVIHPDSSNRLEVSKIVRTLLPNGLLSWNYTGSQDEFYQKKETFIELAASIGRNSIITRLYELGAELSIPNHCPLMAACSALRKDTIRWLLTEHFDHFDCTQRNSNQMNAFLVLMSKQDVTMLDYVLQKMISYRQKYYHEDEAEAFKKIFHYENTELSSLSSLTYLRNGPIREKITEYISHYKLDLSYQWENVTILICLMCRNVAEDYCWSEIRKNPKLLGLVSYGDTTVLHEFIRLGKLDNLPDIYHNHPEVKLFFETERGIGLLREMLFSKRHESASFIMEHHAEYLLNNLDSLKENVLCIYNDKEFYSVNGDILLKYFPMLATEIEEARNKDPDLYPGHDLILAFHKFQLEFDESSIKSKIETPSLSAIRGTKGLSLLHYAVDKDNTSWFTQLLESGCDIDATDDEGNLPIHYVQSMEMFNLVIESHPKGVALVNRTNSDGYTVLHKVCSLYMERKPLCELLEKVIECGANVHALTNRNESAVFMVRNCDALSILRKHNIDLEVVNDDGDNALDCHLRNRNVCMGNALLPLMDKFQFFKDHAHKYLSCFLVSNRDFFSCDYQPFLEENPETTKIIYDSLFQHSREEASRLFNRACGSAHIFISEKFFEFDYDLDYNYKDDYGYTPIIGLCSYMEESNIHLIRQLLKKEVDLDCRNHWGRNALLTLTNGMRSARWYGHDVGSVQLLLDHGAKVNGTDNDGNTALHYACSNNDWELAEMLVENGADLLIKNNEGKIPLENASNVSQELFSFMR
ncbi:uncharacterized protein LOC134215716 [Armigeres subalbatus]|uniref:uncharacterized protein LOC134215716 n=1 Tax=Armigeres subalbatus TaxID=124917 RepID=UPI002ED0A3C4